MIRSQIYNIEELHALLEKNIVKFGDKKRFIHPKTVDNFLFHFVSFKDKKRKDHIYKNLNDYLEELSLLKPEELEANMSVSLFDQYINPILNYYDAYKGFSVYIKWYYFLFVLIFLIGILFLTGIAIYYKTILSFVLIVAFIRNRYKEKIHKTYGVFH